MQQDDRKPLKSHDPEADRETAWNQRDRTDPKTNQQVPTPPHADPARDPSAVPAR